MPEFRTDKNQQLSALPRKEESPPVAQPRQKALHAKHLIDLSMNYLSPKEDEGRAVPGRALGNTAKRVTSPNLAC